MGSTLKEIACNKCFGGLQKVYEHFSNETQCTMKFGVYLPRCIVDNPDMKAPVLYFLSGLTCTQDNFIQKSGFQRYASEHGLIVVNPDTSPRGVNIEGEDESYDFGSGAGFYVDATEAKWAKHYRMYSYVTKELLDLVNTNFPTTGKQGITGHSMGGHGALMCGLKNPDKYSSISAFAPIVNPLGCPWGEKAFTGYLGPNQQGNWANYDSCELAKIYSGSATDILVDQGDQDQFLNNQLFPERLTAAANENTSKKVKINLRMQKGYDHSYFCIATFMEDHIKHHAAKLNSSK